MQSKPSQGPVGLVNQLNPLGGMHMSDPQLQKWDLEGALPSLSSDESELIRGV